jgi:hypothetical protein
MQSGTRGKLKDYDVRLAGKNSNAGRGGDA